MIHLKKAWNWCKAHWKWLTLLLMFSVAYVLGRRGASNLLKAAAFERDQYKVENEKLRIQRELNKQNTKKANEKFNKTAEALKTERDRRINSIKDKTTEEVLEDLGIKKQ